MDYYWETARSWCSWGIGSIADGNPGAVVIQGLGACARAARAAGDLVCAMRIYELSFAFFESVALPAARSRAFYRGTRFER